MRKSLSMVAIAALATSFGVAINAGVAHAAGNASVGVIWNSTTGTNDIAVIDAAGNSSSFNVIELYGGKFVESSVPLSVILDVSHDCVPYTLQNAAPYFFGVACGRSMGTTYVDAGDGNDSIKAYVGHGLTIIGGAGNDTIGDNPATVSSPQPAFTASGSITVFADQGNGVAAASDGDDVINVEDVQGTTATINTGNGNNTVIGHEEKDVVTGGAGTDNIRGGAGNDTLTGGGGADTLDGQGGTDTFHAKDGVIDTIIKGCNDGVADVTTDVDSNDIVRNCP